MVSNWFLVALTAIYVVVNYFMLRAIKRQADIGRSRRESPNKVPTRCWTVSGRGFS